MVFFCFWYGWFVEIGMEDIIKYGFLIVFLISVIVLKEKFSEIDGFFCVLFLDDGKELCKYFLFIIVLVLVWRWLDVFVVFE